MTATLFTAAVAKIWSQPSCLSTDDLIKKMWCVHDVQWSFTWLQRISHSQEMDGISDHYVSEISQPKGKVLYLSSCAKQCLNMVGI